MRKPMLALLVALVACLPAAAQAARNRRPALPPDIVAAAGQDSDSLLKKPAIEARLRKLLGNKYASFMESFETLSPVTRQGDFLFSSGCLIHACTHLESAVAVDLVNRTIHAAIFRRGEKTRYFNEGCRATPRAIRNWAGNLRGVSSQPNNSGRGASFAAPALAAAAVETSPPRRLRAAAPVRGFIGGESHDSYVVRARKGQVLTVRLSWRREGDNRASFSVSESPDFFAGEQVKFGAEYDGGRRWAGKIPRTGDYYVYLVAHPSAHYTLEVGLR
ncbi:MAG TPA: hypothetical protein VN256_14090 [Pyrinomonadaceae bacterium]|nr:hypothetical protein [Pyrinomonadaceae bacterium]